MDQDRGTTFLGCSTEYAPPRRRCRLQQDPAVGRDGWSVEAGYSKIRLEGYSQPT